MPASRVNNDVDGESNRSFPPQTIQHVRPEMFLKCDGSPHGPTRPGDEKQFFLGGAPPQRQSLQHRCLHSTHQTDACLARKVTLRAHKWSKAFTNDLQCTYPSRELRLSKKSLQFCNTSGTYHPYDP